MAASARPRLHEALSTWNIGRAVAKATSMPAPSAPSRAVTGTRAPAATMGLEALPRSPRPSNGAATFSPAVSAGTSHSVAPSAPPVARLVHTYDVASPAEVTQLFDASRTTSSPSSVAVDSGAQKWLREPDSENASVERCSPAAMARRTSSGPCASMTAVAQ